MESLQEQELKEVNVLLPLFKRAHDTYVLFAGGSMTATFGLPVILGINWLMEGWIPVAGVMTLISLLFVAYFLALFWKMKREKYFSSIKSRCIKLQKAGLVVYMEGNFISRRVTASVNAPDDESDVVKFEQISEMGLYHKL